MREKACYGEPEWTKRAKKIFKKKKSETAPIRILIISNNIGISWKVNKHCKSNKFSIKRCIFTSVGSASSRSYFVTTIFYMVNLVCLTKVTGWTSCENADIKMSLSFLPVSAFYFSPFIMISIFSLI